MPSTADASTSPAPCRRRASQKTPAPLEDAPPGHISYQKMRLWREHTVHFTFDKGRDMQVTIRTCDNSRQEAERICRLCYLQFEEGRSKEEVMQYRNRLLERYGYTISRGGRQANSAKRKLKDAESPPAEPAEDDAGSPEKEERGSPAQRQGNDAIAPDSPPKTAKVASPAKPEARKEAKSAPLATTKAPGKAGTPSDEPAAKPVAAKPAAAPCGAQGADDAPEGHCAYAKVRTEGQDAVFEFTSGDATVVFRTSSSSCSNSLAEAERISRLCYLRFEEGLSEQQVRYYRNCLLTGCSFMLAPPRRRLSTKSSHEGSPPTTAAGASATSPAAGKPAAGEGADGGRGGEEPRPTPERQRANHKRPHAGVAAEKKAEASSQHPGKQGEGKRSSPSSTSKKLSSTLRPMPEAWGDAPKGHKAYNKVREQPGKAYMSFTYRGPKGKVYLQTTAASCGGSTAEAERICRLCFLKAEEGLSKEELIRYRNRLYEHCGYGAVTARRPRRGGSGEKKPAAAAPAEDAPEGSLAYKRCRTTSCGKVVAFEHAFKQGGPSTVFQTTTNKCSGSVKEAQRICRLCFTKFEAGWTKDEVLRFREHEYRKCGLRRLCRGGMFYKLGAFHRSPGAAAPAAAAGSEEPSAASAATPEGLERAAEGETPEKECKQPKRGGSEPAVAEKHRCEDAREARAPGAEASGAGGRPAVALPWPALHGAEVAAEAELAARLNHQDGIKGLAGQLRRTDASAQTALHKRFCGRRRLPPRRACASGCGAPAQPGQLGLEGGAREGCAREALLEIEHAIAPITGMVINDLLLLEGENLSFADVLATQAPDVVEIWRELAVDEIR